MGSLSFASPTGLLVAAAGLVPLAALALAELRSRRIRGRLGLGDPGVRAALEAGGAIAVVALLLGAAAAQPMLAGRRTAVRQSRGEVLVVLDTSRSMLAGPGPGAPTRFDRARAAAARIRRELPGARIGLASLTDRLLPHAFESLSPTAFFSALERSVGVDRPPPQYRARRSTRYAALADAVSANYFGRGRDPRVIVVLTDGEGRESDAHALRSLLPKSVRPRTIFVRFWRGDERVFGVDGPLPGYRADPRSRRELDSVAQEIGGEIFGEDELTGVVASLRQILGRAGSVTVEERTGSLALAPYAAGAAFLPLLLLLRRRNGA